jgi:hypothetical protein
MEISFQSDAKAAIRTREQEIHNLQGAATRIDQLIEKIMIDRGEKITEFAQRVLRDAKPENASGFFDGTAKSFLTNDGRLNDQIAGFQKLKEDIEALMKSKQAEVDRLRDFERFEKDRAKARV